MQKYRLPLASMLVIVFLNLGQAQERGEMPAELEINLDRTTKLGLGYHIRGTIALQLPDTDDTFVVKTRMRAHQRLTPVQRKCNLNIAFIPLQIVGRRNQDRLTLSLRLDPQFLQPACNDNQPTMTTSKFMVNTGKLDSTEFTLLVADGSNDERTVEDSAHPGKLTGKLALHLACPVISDARENEPAISVLPTDTVPWPLLFDNSKTSEELSAIATRPSAVLGLTRPSKPYPPLVFFRAASRRAALRQGFCFWVKSIRVEFTPVEILLASKYPAGSCEYTVIREHEMLHYQDMQILFTRYQALVIAALRQASLPTVERPIVVESVLEATNQSRTQIEATLQPIYASMEKALHADADARDSLDKRILSWSQCRSRYPTVARQVTIP